MKTSKADFWFSRWIRIRDTWDDGYCRCITCGKVQLPKHCDCGHYLKRQHQAARFNEMNGAAQCKICNNFEQGNDVIFRQKLVEKYGEEKILLLEASKYTTCKRPGYVMDELERIYKEKTKILAQQKNIELW